MLVRVGGRGEWEAGESGSHLSTKTVSVLCVCHPYNALGEFVDKGQQQMICVSPVAMYMICNYKQS